MGKDALMSGRLPAESASWQTHEGGIDQAIAAHRSKPHGFWLALAAPLAKVYRR